MKTTVIGYARVSSDGQSERQTIQQQVKAIEEYCDDNDFYLIDIYKDDGVSGTSAAKDRVQKLLGFLDEWDKLVNKLAITAYDRLAREAEIQFLFEKELKRRGIELVVIQQQGLENDDPNNKLVRHLMGILSEWERDQIVARVTRGVRNRVMVKGKTICPPYGYQNVGKDTIPHPEEAKVVRYIYDLVLGRKKFYPDLFSRFNVCGSRKLHCKLARQMARKGFRTKIAENRFSANDMMRTVMNTFYCGVMVSRGIYVVGSYEPLVSVSDWVKAAKMMNEFTMSRTGNHWGYPDFTSPEYAELFSSSDLPPSQRKKFPAFQKRF